MAGSFIEGVSKVLSGVYTLIKAAVTSITRGQRGVVSYPFVGNWGPINTLETIVFKNEFDSLYGTALTAGKVGIHAFKGRPSQVLAYRMALPAAAKGQAILNDATSAMSLTLQTLYPSNRSFTAVVSDGLTKAKAVKITEGGILLVSVEGDTLAELIAALNSSDYVRVSASGTTVPVNTAGVSFTGGNNGDVVTVTQYQAYLDTLEADGRANAFALDGVSNTSILTVALEWTKRVRQEGNYITFVQGGPTGWDTTAVDANTASRAINHRGIINVGNGVEGYPAADLAIFVAARAASVALNGSLTDEIVPYASVNRRMRTGERIVAKEAGTLVFVQDGDVIVIDEGVNTLTTPGEGEAVEMGKIRINNALDQICRDLEAFGVAYKRGRSNTQEARETFAAAVEQDYFRSLAAQEIIGADFEYRPDPEYHGDDAVHSPRLDEAYFTWAITAVDSMEKIYQKGSVRFN